MYHASPTHLIALVLDQTASQPNMPSVTPESLIIVTNSISALCTAWAEDPYAEIKTNPDGPVLRMKGILYPLHHSHQIPIHEEPDLFNTPSLSPDTVRVVLRHTHPDFSFDIILGIWLDAP